MPARPSRPLPSSMRLEGSGTLLTSVPVAKSRVRVSMGFSNGPDNRIEVISMSVMMNDVIGAVVENEVSKVSRLPVAKAVPVATALKSAGVKLSTWRVAIKSVGLIRKDSTGIRLPIPGRLRSDVVSAKTGAGGASMPKNRTNISANNRAVLISTISSEADFPLSETLVGILLRNPKEGAKVF
jgi:hypothetical protein